MFHKNLRNIREDCNLTQKQMAKQLGIPVTTYRNYENTYREPSFEILAKICEILHISADELLGIKSDNAKYTNLFTKIKGLNESELQTLNTFVNFLISTR